MILCTEIANGNLKDIFYLFGILSTSIISFVTLMVTIKNRKNSLRENLYKEQLNFTGKLILEFYAMNKILAKINTKEEINLADLNEQIENAYKSIFSNTHIGSQEILLKASEALDNLNKLINGYNEKDSKNKKMEFETYFSNYIELVNTIRNELGVNPLSRENKNLFK